jgi:hypothetical protein
MARQANDKEAAMKNRADVYAEMERIRSKRGGVLTPSDVVRAAQAKHSPLHNHFCWDDTKAAHEYRLWQARELIVRVTIELPEKPDTETQVFVSLRSDRSRKGGGYRHITDVMTNAELRAELLEEALADFRTWEARYQRVRELAPVFAAAKRVKRKAIA